MKAIFFLLTLITVVSCNQPKNQQLPESKAVAIVGTEVVTVDMLSAYLEMHRIINPDEATTGHALEKLIIDVALANVAKKKNIELSTAQLNALEYQKIKLYASNAKQNYLKNNAVTETEINQEYNQAKSSVGGKQYHVHLLLYKDEIQAIKQLEQIKTAADYLAAEQLFKQQNPQMRGVGDIGWVTLAQLPKSFREELSKMQENTFLPKVIHSDFGAHILFLEAVKELTAPKLEDVKAGIIKTLEAKKLSKFTQLARAKANVKLKK